ncbi:hypothetical protein EDEG_00660 [Edhazardia aedis USNM 41457]|uniref:Uncharacterized protein n=1 Tax=Edhazardia aedis (strain USNM 41457) TaxID=1003232 RepID=J9DCT9_EDHAE|nr:hypothetical protein EDEG_00660 [Edhazardia aedis USNM 41457]|eukprot:EJW05284.1 hypothetical protein EDEG_00660 [Edhazardia aedis USNM 41457]
MNTFLFSNHLALFYQCAYKRISNTSINESEPKMGKWVQTQLTKPFSNPVVRENTDHQPKRFKCNVYVVKIFYYENKECLMDYSGEYLINPHIYTYFYKHFKQKKKPVNNI